MREVSVARVAQVVKELLRASCCQVGDDVLAALTRAEQAERSPVGREILRQILENDRLACDRRMPLCQDTGTAVVFLDIGQDVHFTGGLLEDAVNGGVREAYQEGCFRKSILTALGRKNTGDNTPAVLHVRLVAGDVVDVTVAPKGGGSENMSRLIMLSPSQGRQGVIEAVVAAVRDAGANPCPPVVVGVGIGGTAEAAMLLAKRQLLRPIDAPSPDEEMAALESELMKKINALGIGPQGLGGDTTALAVLCAQTPTHLASLPVAVNMQCHACRHAHASI